MELKTLLNRYPKRVSEWASLVSRLVLAVVFAAAALPKLFDPASFAHTISMYGLLPDSVVFLTAILLILIELVIVAGLLFNRGWAVVLAGVLLLMFIAVLGYGVYLGLDIDCGCFGPGDPEHGVLDSLRTSLIRDLVLLVPVVYLMRSHYKTKNYVSEEMS